jgi:hypothetical protein
MPPDDKRMLGYTTCGSVRGQCGHLHKQRAHAENCRKTDSRSYHYVNGYSDRCVVVVGNDGYLYENEEMDKPVPGIGGITSGGLKFARGYSGDRKHHRMPDTTKRTYPSIIPKWS